MAYDHSIIKDAIVERDPSVKRENIVFERVYLSGDRIMAPFRELVWRNMFSIAVEEYEKRKTAKDRQQKLNELGI